MATNIIAFPHAGMTPTTLRSPSLKQVTNRGLHLIAHSETFHNASNASQALANRIVAQIEREITSRAHARTMSRLNAQPIAIGPAAEAPISIVRRILLSLKSFSRSA